MKSLFEQNGGSYRDEGDYYVPNLTVPEETECTIGVWGRLRLSYLKAHKRLLYVDLLTSGKLNEHLRETDQEANERHETIARQMMEAQGVTERLKGEKQMLWAGKVNNIRACADEIIQDELIFS